MGRIQGNNVDVVNFLAFRSGNVTESLFIEDKLSLVQVVTYAEFAPKRVEH